MLLYHVDHARQVAAWDQPELAAAGCAVAHAAAGLYTRPAAGNVPASGAGTPRISRDVL